MTQCANEIRPCLICWQNFSTLLKHFLFLLCIFLRFSFFGSKFFSYLLFSYFLFVSGFSSFLFFHILFCVQDFPHIWSFHISFWFKIFAIFAFFSVFSFSLRIVCIFNFLYSLFCLGFPWYIYFFIFFFGPPALAGRVLWNRICPSFRPSVCPGFFLEFYHYFFLNFSMRLETHIKLCMTAGFSRKKYFVPKIFDYVEKFCH